VGCANLRSLSYLSGHKPQMGLAWFSELTSRPIMYNTTQVEVVQDPAGWRVGAVERYAVVALRTFLSAASKVLPCDMQPGSCGASAT
jgi:hypothetical protein